MRIFITGITGFVGRYLAEYFLEQDGFIVGGTSFVEKPKEAQRNFAKPVTIFQVDLLDRKKVDSIIKKFKPDVIYHLAGVSSTSNAWNDAEFTLKNNIFGQLNLLNAYKEYSPKAKFFIVSSAQVYGPVTAKEIPTRETVFPKPTNPYAVSKLTQELLGYQYAATFDLDIVILRPSNHIGPRQEGNFVVSRFAKQIAEIEKGKIKAEMTVGNLDAKRDFTDVRDIIAAYAVAIKNTKKGEIYNLGSSKPIKISDILKILLSFSHQKIKIKKDKRFLRPSDIPVIHVDYSKFKKSTGWQPKIKIEDTLKQALDYYRGKV